MVRMMAVREDPELGASSAAQQGLGSLLFLELQASSDVRN
jgi:hypothetical protein